MMITSGGFLKLIHAISSQGRFRPHSHSNRLLLLRKSRPPLIQSSRIRGIYTGTGRAIVSIGQSSSVLGGRIIRVFNMSTGGGAAAAAGGNDTRGLVVVPLSKSSALKIQKGDITKWFVDGSSDAIVNPANERMLGGGGADGAIHRAAGPELVKACYEVPEVKPGVRCPTGEARITPGFNLPAAYVVHTVGPIYDTDPNPKASLRNAYKNSLHVAEEKDVQYIAFTAISCGVYGYPYEEAATTAISTVKEFGSGFKEVHFVLFSDEIYDVWVNKTNELLQK
ncbi:hypothetical protein Dimus_022080 [Dionaea muscipula]